MVVILCAPLTLVAGFLLWHSVFIGFFAPRETLEFFQFGSEAMGWRFQSRTVYFVSGVVEVSLLFGVSGLLAWWLLRKPRSEREPAKVLSDSEAE